MRSPPIQLVVCYLSIALATNGIYLVADILRALLLVEIVLCGLALIVLLS